MFITNTINKQVFDFTCTSEMIARQMQQEIVPNITHSLDDIINKILAQEFDKDKHLVIDKIEIDLGDIAIQDYGNDEMLQHFKESLKEKIAACNNKQNISENDKTITSSEAELQIIAAFLSSGNFPWWADKTARIDLDKMLETLIRQKPEAIKSFLLKQDTGSVAERLVKQFKPSARSAIEGLLPGFINQYVRKTTFFEGEYKIDIKEFPPKILKKLGLIKRSKISTTGKEYKPSRLAKLLKQPFYKWIKALQLINILSLYQVEKIKLLHGSRNKNKRREAIEILKKLSVFQIEFLLQKASSFPKPKTSEYENTTVESKFSADEFLNEANVSVSSNTFSYDNLNSNTPGTIGTEAQLLYAKTIEQNEIEHITNRQDSAGFETKIADINNKRDQNKNVIKEIFVNESSIEKISAGESVVRENFQYNVSAEINNSSLIANRREGIFLNNNKDQFSILKNERNTNSDAKTSNDDGASNTSKIFYNNQEPKNQSEIISSENEKKQTNKSDQQNLDVSFFSNKNGSAENDEIESKQTTVISTKNEGEQIDIDNAKNLDHSLFPNKNIVFENNKIASNQSNAIAIENNRKQNENGNVKNLVFNLYQEENTLPGNSGIAQKQDNNISNKFSGIRSVTKENNYETNEKSAFFHLDNNIKLHTESNENKQDENREVNNYSKDFSQFNSNKTERVVADTNSSNSSNKDFLIGEKTYDKIAKQSDEDREGNKRFKYKNSETQQNSRDGSDEEFSFNDLTETKNIDQTICEYNYKKRSRIEYILKKLSGSNQDLSNELNLLKEQDLSELETQFKQLERTLNERKKVLNSIIEHPYLFEYDLLKILAGSYSIKAAPSDLTKQTIEKNKPNATFLSVLLHRILLSQPKFFNSIDNLNSTEIIVLEDVLKKKSYATKSEKKTVKKIFKKLPEETIHLLHFFTQLPDHEVQQLSSLLKKDTRKSNNETSRRFPVSDFANQQQKIHIENAGLCIIATYFPLLFNNLKYLEDGIFKNKAVAARALFLTQYIASGQSKSPEYLLQFNKLLCGFQMEESVPSGIRLTKKERMEADDLLSSVTDNWDTIKNTSRNGFRQSFLQRRGILTENELTWTLQVEPKSYDMLLSTITWGFGIIKLPWMKKHIQVEW